MYSEDRNTSESKSKSLCVVDCCFLVEISFLPAQMLLSERLYTVSSRLIIQLKYVEEYSCIDYKVTEVFRFVRVFLFLTVALCHALSISQSMWLSLIDLQPDYCCQGK